MESIRLLVIGNGMAGLKFLEELIMHAPSTFEITVIGEEPYPAYNRVLLSPLLAGSIKSTDIEFKSKDWYVAQRITLLTNTKIVGLNVAKREATTECGKTIAYDICVLATGSEPIRLPLQGANLAGVDVFRSLNDVTRLRSAAEEGAPIAVIGGGLLGIEAAYGLKQAGANVTLIHLMDRLMERQLDSAGAAFLRRAIEERDIKVVLNAETAAIRGDTHANAVQLKDGRKIPASLVVMSVGIRPRTELAKIAALKVNRGIVVNARMETSEPNVYAIGECTEFDGMLCGLVEPAYEHARVAARAICGSDAFYAGTVPSTNLKVSGVPVFSAGNFLGDGAENIIWIDRDGGAYRKFLVRHDVLIGVILVGDTTDSLWYRDLIQDRTNIKSIRSTLAFGRAYAEAA